MPENQQLPRREADVGEQLFARLAGALTGRVLGDVPDEEKVSVLDGLVSCLDELTAINRYFAANLWDKFGDEETGELAKKPDLRDFLTAWTEATVQFMGEQEAGETDEDDDLGEEPDLGDEDDEGPPPPEGEPPVLEADFKVVGKGGKKS